MSARTANFIWTACVSWLLVVSSLVLWSLAPIGFGLRPIVIVSGSMMPVIAPGDVVLIDPAATPRRGQVVLVRDRFAPTGFVVHRVVAVGKDGRLTTKGDANRTADTDLRSPADVQGVARLLVPKAGRLALLRGAPTSADRTWALVTLASAAGYLLTRTRRLTS